LKVKSWESSQFGDLVIHALSLSKGGDLMMGILFNKNDSTQCADVLVCLCADGVTF
jgi:hypothetical protein